MPAVAPHTPATIPLTEAQAEAIETAAEQGHFYVPPHTIRGARFRRDRAEALQRKGIFTDPRPHTDPRDDGDCYDLTDYGRQVYNQHPRVIRR